MHHHGGGNHNPHLHGRGRIDDVVASGGQQQQRRGGGGLLDLSFATDDAVLGVGPEVLLFILTLAFAGNAAWFFSGRSSAWAETRSKMSARVRPSELVVGWCAALIFVAHPLGRIVQLLHVGRATLVPMMLSTAVTTAAALVAPSFMVFGDFSLAILTMIIVVGGTVVEVMWATHALAVALLVLGLLGLVPIAACVARHWGDTELPGVVDEMKGKSATLDALTARREKLHAAKQRGGKKQQPQRPAARVAEGFKLQ